MSEQIGNKDNLDNTAENKPRSSEESLESLKCQPSDVEKAKKCHTSDTHPEQDPDNSEPILVVNGQVMQSNGVFSFGFSSDEEDESDDDDGFEFNGGFEIDIDINCFEEQDYVIPHYILRRSA